MNQTLANYNESERARYMMVVAHMAGVDGDLASEEIYALREMCIRYVLGPEARGEVMAATALPADALEEVLGKLAGTDLKNSLLVDLFAMAYMDGVVKPEEAETLNKVAQALAISDAQMGAIERLAKILATPTPDPAALQQALASLQDAGISSGSLAMSTTFARLGKV